jgi:hypothetical protein
MTGYRTADGGFLVAKALRSKGKVQKNGILANRAAHSLADVSGVYDAQCRLVRHMAGISTDLGDWRGTMAVLATTDSLYVGVDIAARSGYYASFWAASSRSDGWFAARLNGNETGSRYTSLLGWGTESSLRTRFHDQYADGSWYDCALIVRRR